MSNNNYPVTTPSIVGAKERIFAPIPQHAMEVFFVVMKHVAIVLGVLVFLVNMLVFTVLVKKRKKRATEVLVLFNLFMDSVYGLDLIIKGWMEPCKYHSKSDATFGEPCYWTKTALYYIPQRFLVFTSLMLFIVMTLNRYVAVVRPFSYKVYFKMRNVIKCLLAIVTTNLTITILEGALLATDASVNATRIFRYCLISIKLSLVAINAVIMIITYRAIANQFVGNFWVPVLVPLRALFFFRCRRKHQKYQTIKIRTAATVKNSPAEIEDSKNVNATVTSNYIIGADTLELPEISGSSEERNSSVVKPAYKNHPNVSQQTASKFGSNASIDSSECSVLEENNVIKAGHESRQQKQMHKLTSTFFFVGIAFILLSIPRSICMIAMMISNRLRKDDNFWGLFIVSYLFYGLNFLLNPYLYSFNNNYLKDEIRRLAREAFRCCTTQDEQI